MYVECVLLCWLAATVLTISFFVDDGFTLVAFFTNHLSDPFKGYGTVMGKPNTCKQHYSKNKDKVQLEQGHSRTQSTAQIEQRRSQHCVNLVTKLLLGRA